MKRRTIAIHMENNRPEREGGKIMCDCGHMESDHSDITRGYGIDGEGKTHCVACCAEQTRQRMRDTGRITLYLEGEGPDRYWLTDWHASLVIFPYRARTGRHNWAGKRYDVWFSFEECDWHGVQYGDNTQLCHCKRCNGERSSR